MLTMQRIREILSECGLAGSQLDDTATYFYSCQLELTEQDVRDFAEIIKRREVDNA